MNSFFILIGVLLITFILFLPSSIVLAVDPIQKKVIDPKQFQKGPQIKPTLPPGVGDVPTINEFRVNVPNCSLPNPNRAIISYRVSSNTGGTMIQQVRINALHRDERIRTFYQQSANPRSPFPGMGGSNIKDPAPTPDTIAYVLVVTGANGQIANRRVDVVYNYPMQFEILSSQVRKWTQSNKIFYSVDVIAENINSVNPCIGYEGYEEGTRDCYSRTTGLRRSGGRSQVVFNTDEHEDRRDHAAGDVEYTAQGIAQDSCIPERIRRLASFPADPGYNPDGTRIRTDGSGSTTIHASMEICAYDPVPAGYIKVDDRWDPTICGNPTTITYNVWILNYYADRPVGSTIEVCGDAPTPTGWSVYGRIWNPKKCHRASSPSGSTENVNRIRRVK